MTPGVSHRIDRRDTPNVRDLRTGPVTNIDPRRGDPGDLAQSSQEQGVDR
jgi:hypothetical protein